MGNKDAEQACNNLHDHIKRSVRERYLASDQEGERDGGIEMRAGYSAKDQNEDDKDRPGRNCVPQQGDRDISR